jgi:aspartyl protease family protein
MIDRKRDHNPHRRLGTGMMVLAWLVFLVLVGFYFQGILDERRNPNQQLVTRESGSAREVVLQRNRAGHYVASGQINGQPVVFMLDTGATGVAIPARLASQLGLPRGQRFATQTANGVAPAYATRLGSVRVGDIELRDVSASIAPGLATEEILLGMSFLKHIEFTQRGDKLILRQYL